MDKHATLDCFGLLCPMPIIKLAQKIKELKPGEILELISTDEGIKEDAPAWCEATGNEFLGCKEEDEQYKVYIRRVK